MTSSTFSRYEIAEKLGQGGMGEVFLAHDPSLDRRVALKLLPEDLRHDETAKKRFLREARSAAALDHPYICKIYEIGESEETSFIAMEYVRGETLEHRLARGAPSLAGIGHASMRGSTRPRRRPCCCVARCARVCSFRTGGNSISKWRHPIWIPRSLTSSWRNTTRKSDASGRYIEPLGRLLTPIV